jgi:ribosomal protein L7/L12
MNLGETTTATADVAVSASKVLAASAQAGSIVVTSKNAAAVDVTSATVLTATITGPGTLGIDTAANVASIASTGRGITGTAGQNTIGVFSDGTSGVATITISAGTTVLATETVTFYGDVASVVATVVNSVIPASNTGASVGAVTAVAYDAAGVVVGAGNLYATSSVATVASNSYTSAAITAGKATFTLVGVAAGTTTITVGTGSSATATTNIASAPVTVRVGSSTPASVSVTWDKDSYVPGEVATVKVTLLDATGLALPNATYANIFAAGGLTPSYALGSASATITGTDVVAATSTGSASYTVFVPAYATSLQLKYTGGTGLPAAAQIAGTSATVTVGGGQAADAATAAADAAAAAPVAAAAGGAAAGGGAAEAQDEFTVILEEAGSQKIAVIKEVRNLNSSLGLKEAKDLVDATPATLLEKVNKETADKAKAALEAAGAKVTVK